MQLKGDNMQSAYTVNVDASGNIIVSGYFEGIVDFDPGAANLEFTANGPDCFHYEAYVSRKSCFGQNPFLNVDGTSSIYAVNTDASNNIFIGGSIFGTAMLIPIQLYSILSRQAVTIFGLPNWVLPEISFPL
ncbi:MAG: hypothetical protein WDO15_23710 [Bacteroidota bacterium]